MRLHIDIETRSSVDIKSAGLYRYAESPDFEILLIAYAVNDDPVQLIDMTAPGDEDALSWLRAALQNHEYIKHAYNAAFEVTCLNRAGFTSPVNQWHCTMAHSLYCGYADGLGAVGAALGLPEDKRKLSIGRSLINLFCKPQPRMGIAGRVTPAQEPEKWALFIDYCKQDVEAERQIEAMLAPWPLPEREQHLWRLDYRMNSFGVLTDSGLVEGALYCGNEIHTRLMNEATAISGLDNPRSVAQFTKWLNQELPEEDDLTDLRKDTVSSLLERGVKSESATRMLEIRQQLGKSSIKKYDAIAAARCSDGRVRGLLQYYGASRTGRWAGRLVQVQNLPRNYLNSLSYARGLVKEGRVDLLELMYGNVPDTLSQLIRTALVPPPGQRYLISDFSAIEARVIAWLAGERWVMDVFAGHGKIYEATAAQMFSVPIEKITKGQPEYALRSKGKIATLALGYGGSSGALINMGALRMGLTEDELPDIVHLWRAANPNICRLWREVETAAITCVQTGGAQSVRGLSFQRERTSGCDFLTITLPAGRQLFYAEPVISTGKFDKPALYYRGISDRNKWESIATFGGKLTENIIQAIARDCLAETLLQLEAAGYNTVFHVHDEVIIESPEAAQLQPVLDIMARPISWAPGLVLRGDGYSAEYYKKD